MVRLISRLLPTVLGTSLLVLALPGSVPADVTLGQTLNVEPETAQQAVGTTVTFTATVPRGTTSNVNVDFEILGGVNDPDDDDASRDAQDGENNFRAPPDLTCTTAASGTCSVTIADAGQADHVDEVRAWIDADGVDATTEVDMGEGRDELVAPGRTLEPDGTDVVQVTWGAAPAPVATSLDVSPGDPPVSLPLDGTFAPTMTVLDQFGGAFSGANVVFRVETGPNAGVTGECDTQVDGTCTPSGYTTAGEGVDRVRAWIDTDGDDLPDEADLLEGRDEAAQPGLIGEPDGTDVVEVRWEDEKLLLDVTPETATDVTGTTRTIQAIVRNQFQETRSAPVGFVVRSGPNQGNQMRCTTSGPQGSCTIDISSDAEGTDVVLAWIDSNDNEFADEADAGEGRDEGAPGGQGQVSEPDATDVVEVTWALPAPVCPGHEDDPRNHIVGSAEDDVLEGTAAAEIICGLGGDDVITGAGGGDLLLGGAGNDRVRGGAGIDIVVGGSGDDEIRGNRGSDELRAGRGVDGVLGGDGDDVLFTRDGRRDRLVDGGRGDDRARRDPNDPTRRVEHFF